MTTAARLVVLISGSGSNLQAVLDGCSRGILQAEVAAVVSNRPDAYGLLRAQSIGIPTVVFPAKKGQERSAYDLALADVAASFHPDWLILAGWMRLLTGNFINHFTNRVINLHPALPGTFPGVHAIERAFHAWQCGQIPYTGVMVHLVPDEGVDNGPLLNQRIVPFEDGDTLEKLESRIHNVEHELLVETIQDLITIGLERTILNAKSNSLCTR